MAVGKKLRFEVFKRDKFACQYCGQKAPDVVLHADHIHPVVEGGEDTLLNLITSCVGCNLGKGARVLSDDSAVEKQRRQLEELADRREQLEMMVDWQRGLATLDRDATEQLAGFWCELVEWEGITDAGKIKGICHMKGVEKEKPYMKDVFYIRGILKNTLSYVKLHEARELLEMAFEEGSDTDTLKRIAFGASTWSRWSHDMYEHLDELRKDD